MPPGALHTGIGIGGALQRLQDAQIVFRLRV
jgi:hypothetical protein